MKIINLIEDTNCGNEYLSEHGLSFYIETKEHKLLVDTGASSAFVKNAEKLGVNLSLVDTVVLSHGHYDHTGGLLSFVEINKTADIYIQQTALNEYYNLNCETPRYIGVDKFIGTLPQLKLINGNLRIDDELFLFTNIKRSNAISSGNKTLVRKEGEKFIQDDFRHEQCLAITCEGKEYLLSGCAHNGILNILEEYKRLFSCKPDCVISGFHMMKKEGYNAEDIQLINKIAEILNKTDTIYYTCHCTTKYPYQIMKAVMQDKLHWVYSGDEIKL